MVYTCKTTNVVSVADRDPLTLTKLKSMMDMPVSHLMGPVGYEMTNEFGFDHPAVTLGMLIAQAIREAHEYELPDGTEYSEPTSFRIDSYIVQHNDTD